MAKTLHIVVADKIATYAAGGGYIVCGNGDYELAFTFDAEWDDHPVKTARFIANGKITDVVFEGTTVAVPKLHNATQVSVGVYSGELKTTTTAVIRCMPCVTCSGGVPDEPTPDVYGQVIDLINTRVNQDGQDGGYYVPGMSENDDGTVTMSFTPSADDMPAVDPFTFAVGGDTSSAVKIVPFIYGPADIGYYCIPTVPFAEIYQAFQDGMTLVATTGTNVFYYLSNISETTVEFVRCYAASGKVTVDTITLNANDVASFTRDQVSPAKLVTINQVYQMGGYTYSSDATPSDIHTAFSAGQSITAVLKFSGVVSGVMQMVSCNSVQTVFNRCVQSGDNLIVTTYTIGSDKTVTVSTLTVPTGVKSWAVPQAVTADTRITDAGYYYAYAAFSGIEGVVGYNFGVFYFKPNTFTPTVVAATLYAGNVARLTIRGDGQVTFNTVTQTVNGTTVSNSYNDGGSMYTVYLAKLS